VIEQSAAGTHIWWLGQSGFLIGHEGRHLLVDPYLSDSLTAKYEGTETPHIRMHPHVVAPEQLSFIDIVLSTHGHTDHLDGATLSAIGAPLIAPASRRARPSRSAVFASRLSPPCIPASIASAM
jgi:L-ascorbate metabolism protein UlaG (beta-lactamase superfamily)